MATYAKSVSKPKGEINMSWFSFLFSEIIQYLQKHDSDKDIEQSLTDFANPIGERVLELAMFREKMKGKRYTNIVDVLHFIHSPVWKLLFGRQADGLEQNSDEDDEYWLRDDQPVTNKYIWTKSKINWAAFIAGIIEGILWAIEFPAKVSAHFWDDNDPNTTVYVIKFTKEALENSK